MKKLLIAASVALLVLSFQVSAAPVNMLKLSIEDNDLADVKRMGIVGSPFASALPSDNDIVVGAAKVVSGVEFVHDWGLELGDTSYRCCYERSIVITTVFLNAADGFNNLNPGHIISAQLYTDTTFTNRLYSYLYGGDTILSDLKKVNHTYGLRITGVGARTRGSYTFNAGVVPIPAAVWLFGSGMAGLLGLSRRKAKAAIPSV